MLVLFQRRIIYLPSVPPGTRDESLEDGERTTARDGSLSGLDWRQVRIESMVPTSWLRRPVELRGIEMSWSGPATTAAGDATQRRPRVVIVYLQGEHTVHSRSSSAPHSKRLDRERWHAAASSPSLPVAPARSCTSSSSFCSLKSAASSSRYATRNRTPHLLALDPHHTYRARRPRRLRRRAIACVRDARPVGAVRAVWALARRCSSGIPARAAVSGPVWAVLLSAGHFRRRDLSSQTARQGE